MPRISGIDHLVLTAVDLDRTIRFYTQALGMTLERFTSADGSVRQALLFMGQKINLRQAADPFVPHAA